VVLVLFHGRSAWFHSMNSPADVALLYDYVERMLLAENYLDPPPELAERQFERYVDAEEGQTLSPAVTWRPLCNTQSDNL
jgi:hypothetical protein